MYRRPHPIVNVSYTRIIMKQISVTLVGSLVEDDSPTPVRRESREEEVGGDKEPSSDKSGLEEEFAPIDVEDTSSFLETLDNEVSLMQDEVSQRESEIDTENEVKDDVSCYKYISELF